MKALGVLLTALLVSWAAHAKSAEHTAQFHIKFGILHGDKDPKLEARTAQLTRLARR